MAQGFVSGAGLQVTVNGTTVYQGSAGQFCEQFAGCTVSVNVGIIAQSLSVKVTLPGGESHQYGNSHRDSAGGRPCNLQPEP